MIKRFLGVFLSVAMAVPSGATVTTSGTLKGVVSIAGRGLDGISFALVNVETGRSFAVRSAADGSFTATLPPGSYVFSSPGRSGVSISRAPLSIEVVSGKVASANVELSSLATQDPATPAGSTKIIYDPADCITEGEFTLIEATFDPLSSVVNGRLYFQSNLSPEWFYTVFELIDPAVAGGPTHRAFIPKVNKDGGIETINSYLQVTSTDFAETKTPEHSMKVVAGATECEGKLAAIGTPDGAVSVLSASGSVAGALAGFGGVAGVGLGALAIAAIVGGVVVAGVVVQQVVTDPTPTPTPPVVVPSTPTPTPTPTATPVRTCNLVVTTTPNVVLATGGVLCRADVQSPAGAGIGTVSGSRTFVVPCTNSVLVFANVAPQSSLTTNAFPAEWIEGCSGSALGAPCGFTPLGTNREVTLRCSQTF